MKTVAKHALGGLGILATLGILTMLIVMTGNPTLTNSVTLDEYQSALYVFVPGSPEIIPSAS